MSQQNVEIVRRFMRCLENQDIEGAFVDVHPQGTLDWSDSNALDSGVYTGHAAWRTFMRTRDEALSERRFDSAKLAAPTDDSVLVIARVQEQGRASGIEVKTRGAGVSTLRRKDRPLQDLPVERRGPQSRRPGGVGDVAGERRRHPGSGLPSYWMQQSERIEPWPVPMT
jgi:hypothetical protein